MKKKPAKKRTSAISTAPMLQIGGDSADRRELVRVLAANLPKAIANGQREIVASLIQGIAGTFPVTGTSVSYCNFQQGK